MRAVQFDYADRNFPASLVELPEPELPGPQWARVAVTVGGICGSDLHLFSHNVGPTPTLFGMGSLPFVLGHEIAGRVVEAGRDCPVAVGTAVAVDPCIPCLPRGIDPPCVHCAQGWSSACLNLDSGKVSVGRTLGFTRDLGGGWADQVLAHSSMLHPLPAGVAEETACLHEPLSIACHGLLRAPPVDGAACLVVGAGVVGLAALSSLRGLYPDCPVSVLARHDSQAEAALRCGAARVVRPRDDGTHFEELATASGSRVIGFGSDFMLMGGFPYVVEAVGSPRSVTEALRAVSHRGTVLLLGAAGISEVDLTPVWYKEAALVGSIDHSVDAGRAPGLAGAPNRHSVDRALDVLAAGLFPPDAVISHEFGLESFRDAVSTAVDRSSGARKVVFRP